MNPHVTLLYRRPPSAAVYMARAFYPSAGLGPNRDFPAIEARWAGHRVDPRQLGEFLQLTGLPGAGQVHFLYPQVFAFRLLMAILTHPAYPLPIWGALQVRNHLLQRHPIPLEVPLDVETVVAGHRLLEKGLEVDLHTTLRVEALLAWESITTFYYRGRFRGDDPPSSLDRRPEPPRDGRSTWTTSAGGGWRFARLTGDYNGIHSWGWYARRFGHPRAFLHPQAVAGACLSRLRALDPAKPQRLDLWIKGPVYYGAAVELRAADDPDGTRFALHLSGDDRPALLGRWSGDIGEELRK